MLAPPWGVGAPSSGTILDLPMAIATICALVTRAQQIYNGDYVGLWILKLM